MLTNGKLTSFFPFFGGEPGFNEITFKEFFANNEKNVDAFDFFRT